MGKWFESAGPDPEGRKCDVDENEIEIVRSGNRVQVAGRSGDWVCTWSEGRILSRTVERDALPDMLRESLAPVGLLSS
jgi:hypothetical protein